MRPFIVWGSVGGSSVFADVFYLATAGTGGVSLQRRIYAVTFYGDDVSPGISNQLQIQITIAIPNVFTSAQLRAAIVAAVQAKAVENGLVIVDAKVMSPMNW